MLYAALLALSGQVMADAPDKAKLKRCTELSGTARAVMKARQNGVPMSKLMAVESGSKAFDDVMAEMVKDAFSKSKYDTEKFKKDSIQEFEDKWFALCIS
jgi:hypothetical protein